MKTRVLLVTLLALAPFAAQAAFINLMAQRSNLMAGIDGASERPNPVITNGSGAGAMILDTDSGKLTWSIAFKGLEGGPAIAAHFHGPAGIDETGPVLIDLAVSAGQGGMIDGIGKTEGLFLGMANLAVGDLPDILNGLWYINIHTDKYKPGEIRGQVVRAIPASPAEPAPVPLPATLGMLMLALGLVGIYFRRRGVNGTMG